MRLKMWRRTIFPIYNNKRKEGKRPSKNQGRVNDN
jgi:hypothetical protein